VDLPRDNRHGTQLRPGIPQIIIQEEVFPFFVYLTAQFLASHRGCDVVYLPVDPVGRIDLGHLHTVVQDRLRGVGGGVGLVSLMYVNNEIGVVQDLPAIRRVLRSLDPEGSRVCLHTDAVQAPGHVPCLNVEQLGVDFLSLAGHKFHGPPGIGALYCRDPSRLRPVYFGGHQQGGSRPGTECVALATAFASALRVQEETPRLCVFWVGRFVFCMCGVTA
jgi:cysteine desulfurase